MSKGAANSISCTFLVLLPLALSVRMIAAEADAQRLNASAQVLTEIMAASDKSIPIDLFHKAYCVVVIPGMKKAGFMFSGKYGRGFASCRNPEGAGWTAPAAMRIEGGGFGLQAGGSETDVIMLVMSQKGMKGILASKFTVGGEASVAAGPVGREGTAQTDASLHADILSWSRSKGAFAGISLQGATLRADTEANKVLYGQDESNTDILTGKVKPPSDASTFLDDLTKYGGESRGA